MSGNMSGRTRNTKAAAEKPEPPAPGAGSTGPDPTFLSLSTSPHVCPASGGIHTTYNQLLGSAHFSGAYWTHMFSSVNFSSPQKSIQSPLGNHPPLPSPSSRGATQLCLDGIACAGGACEGVVSCVTSSLSSFSLPSAFAGHPSRSTCQDMAPCPAAFVWSLPHC